MPPSMPSSILEREIQREQLKDQLRNGPNIIGRPLPEIVHDLVGDQRDIVDRAWQLLETGVKNQPDLLPLFTDWRIANRQLERLYELAGLVLKPGAPEFKPEDLLTRS